MQTRISSRYALISDVGWDFWNYSDTQEIPYCGQIARQWQQTKLPKQTYSLHQATMSVTTRLTCLKRLILEDNNVGEVN